MNDLFTHGETLTMSTKLEHLVLSLRAIMVGLANNPEVTTEEFQASLLKLEDFVSSIEPLVARIENPEGQEASGE